MDEAGFDTAHVVGSSLGGFVALQLAARGRARTVVAFAPAGGWAAGDDSLPEVLGLQARLHEQARATAPHAEAIVATAEGRRRATQLVVSSCEHIPPELIAHQMLAVASAARRAGPDRARPARGLRRARRAGHRLPGAHRVGHRRPAAAMAVGRRALSSRVACARRLGRAGRRRSFPAARRPARGRSAHPRLHGRLTPALRRRGRGPRTRPAPPRAGGAPARRSSAGWGDRRRGPSSPCRPRR